MGLLTASLSGVELTFSVIKSIFQNTSWSWGAWAAAACFYIESGVGIALGLLLATSAVHSDTKLEHKKALLSGVFLIFISEIMSISVEFRHMLVALRRGRPRQSEIRRSSGDAIPPKRGDGRRKLMRSIALASGTAAPVSAIIALELDKASIPFAEPLMGISIGINIFLLASVHFFPKNFRMRLLVSLLYLLAGTVFSLIVQFRGWNSDKNKLFSLDAWITAAVFCSTISCACTAVAAWALPSVQKTVGVVEGHAEVFETAALGMTGPAVVMAFANGVTARNVFLTIFPQVGAILLPILFSYAAFRFQNRKARNELLNISEDNDSGESKIPDRDEENGATETSDSENMN